MKECKLPNGMIGVEEKYHVRERDNHVAIVLSQPGWAATLDTDYWYVSIQDLDSSNWRHRDGSTYQGGKTKAEALQVAMREAAACDSSAKRCTVHDDSDTSGKCSCSEIVRGLRTLLASAAPLT